MTWIVVVLYVLAAVLPILGLYQPLGSAFKRSDDPNAHLPFDQYVEAWSADVVSEHKREAVRNTVLVGGGLVCGAVASIWSLFL